jgi:glycosyltransferase involved in cell wall biosynthesis
MYDLSILIPARNEAFLSRTIEDILANRRGDTEVIAVLDGEWADPVIEDHPRVTLIKHSKSIGQRASINEAARMSTARYIMKVDAHCAFDIGFDEKLMEEYEDDQVVVPRMYNLHVFDRVCECGHREYQGGTADCPVCQKPLTIEMIWKPRLSRRTDYSRFDHTLHFQYWRDYEKRMPNNDIMCFVGAGFFLSRDRFWELDGMDEGHGSWGQMGVEVSCKSWLSGGRIVVNKNTWFAHLFRTQPGFGFPYPMNPSDQEKAREYSRWMWQLEHPDELPHWNKAIRPLRWILDKFHPVPEWHT